MTSLLGRILSRNLFLRTCSSIAFASLGARLASGQKKGPPPLAGIPGSSLETVLFKEFKGAQLLAVSPDGALACLYSFRRLETFLRAWSYDGGKTKSADDVMKVIELQTGQVVYSTKLRSMVISASFFADSRRLYSETFPLVESEGGRATVFQQAVVDLRTRKLEERLCRLGVSYTALDDRSVLGHEFSLESSGSLALVLATVPGYNEIVRVPFSVAQEPERYGRPRVSGIGLAYGHDATPVVSADRGTVVYGAGHQIVCRRTSDLRVLWTRQVEPEYSGVWSLALTPDASRLAAAIIGGSDLADKDKFYVGVYDGKDGSVRAKLPLNALQGVSISPDGRFIATPLQIKISERQVQPAVNIYDAASGNQIGQVTHPAVSVSGPGRSGSGPIGCEFTPDGKYLITSALDTKVWRIGTRE